MRLTVVMLHELSYAVSVCLKSRHMTQDGMGREEGGGFRMGNTCIHMGNTSVADSF